MDTKQILALLIAERDRLNQAIAALQGGNVAQATRGSLSSGTRATAEKKASTIVRTPEQREAQAERMRAYWANRKKAAKKASKKEA